MKHFSTSSPCALSLENIDRSCAQDSCPECEYNFKSTTNDTYFFHKVNIVAICKAPFIGGFNSDRPLAIVYECPNCWNYFWFHTTEAMKTTLNSLLDDGGIKKINFRRKK